MAKTSLTVKVHIEGVREVLRAFSVLPKDAQNAIRDHSQKLAQKLATKAVVDVSAHGGPQGPLLATTVKTVRDRVPAIQVGGTRRLGRHRAPAYGMLFGSIFGMNGRSGWFSAAKYKSAHGHQYRPHQGQDAYAFFPLVEREAATISREWHAAVDDVVRKFSAGD
ncbi:hypothetical protein [Amycolatopsis jiangsuensis]|uniref:HK97 gp10 family phage protein n=1 Tax=Amycolatopsis jiangsuensis TaxID=1181879 RepID=A0A840J8V9_9PSEU|nr:hypothetical protein [Amycolatopsis jiangsuensis]MBB4689828.1 hypothetical protein [Amycolatopsis jiangsuensis]